MVSSSGATGRRRNRRGSGWGGEGRSSLLREFPRGSTRVLKARKKVSRRSLSNSHRGPKDTWEQPKWLNSDVHTSGSPLRGEDLAPTANTGGNTRNRRRTLSALRPRWLARAIHFKVGPSRSGRNFRGPQVSPAGPDGEVAQVWNAQHSQLAVHVLRQEANLAGGALESTSLSSSLSLGEEKDPLYRARLNN
ncbi:uncharacterized protein LOC144233484 [Crocuta crocuta]